MQRPSSNLQDVTNQSKRQRLSLDGDPVFSGASKPYSSTTNPHTRHASVDSTVSHQRRGPPRSENIPPNHQKRPTSAAPEININLHLAHPKWGLSKEFITGLRNCGIEEMYEWQAECLSVEGLLQGESNLVYSAPASAGKCLVADILMVKRVLQTRMKALVVLPYAALVTEKTRFLTKILENIDPPVKVVGFHGGATTRLTWKDADIAVCTIERANSIINAALEDCSIGEFGVVVFDKLHMLENDHRGSVLEVLASKILCLPKRIQIIGMSATLSNISELASWLKAACYNSTYRSIPLQEYLVYDNAIYNEKEVLAANIPKSDLKELSDPVTNAIVTLVYGCVAESHSALVFCSSRDGAENLSRLLQQFMPPASEEILERRRDILRDLAMTAPGLDPTLERTIPCGIGFHHAGLTTQERELVANAYDQGLVQVICCTAPIAAGASLLARRVILSPRMGRGFLSPVMLHQMRGRAGRKGRDTIGESYLCCYKSDLDAVKELTKAAMPKVTSCLANQGIGLKRALLEVIATRLATSEHSLDGFIQCTFLYHTAEDKERIAKLVKDALDFLISAKLIAEDMGSYKATTIGTAIVASRFDPEEGLFLFNELNRAVKTFNLETEMHVIYSSTPIYSHLEVNWKIFRNEFEGLDESGMWTAEFVGVNPGLINRMARGGTLKEDTPTNIERFRVHRRFFVSLILRDLLNEQPIHVLAEKYQTPRGVIQQLVSTCIGFATTTGTFCRSMGWTGLSVLLDHYAFRIDMGVRDELLDLAKLPFVKSYTARIVFDAGLRSISAVAAVNPEKLIPILESAQPQQLKLRGEEHDKLKQRLHERALIIIRAARRIHEQGQILELDD